MKKVLMITYLFPPIGGGGVQRTVKFAKYLPQFGWEPLILTVEEKNYKGGWWQIPDPELLEDLPKETKIYRTFSLDFIFQGKIGKLIHYLARILFAPDDELISWFIFALQKGVAIIKDENIDVIYSTYAPITNHFVAMFLERITGKPWIADFRDPWTTNPNYRPLSPIPATVERYCESQIYKNCDFILTSTEGYRQELLANFPFVKQEKVLSLTNGYDHEDFEQIETSLEKDATKFTITYPGSFVYDRSPEWFLKALKLLIEREPKLKKKIQVNFVGTHDEQRTLVSELKLEEMVFFRGFVSHKEAVNWMLNSDVLLQVLTPRHVNCLPQKIFLYLKAGKPILALVPDGSCKDLVLEANAGIVVDPHDINKIAEAIHELFRRFQSGEKFEPKSEIVQKYDRRLLTQKLAQVLNNVNLNKINDD